MQARQAKQTATVLAGLWLAAAATAGVTPAPGAEVPITTGSAEARAEYLEGRGLVERLRATDARGHYAHAAELDPSFALTQLGLATTATTASEFFTALRAAVSLAGSASPGETHMILAFEAGVNGQPDLAHTHLAALVAAYPDDERAHNLLGNYYFGRQEWEPAIVEYRRAIEVEPAFSQPYNQLGYALRSVGRLDEAEKVFATYIALIPDEPNPYDSYAELLMKMGRFADSIAQYEKALAVDRNFVASYVGIANDAVFMGRPEESRKALARLDAVARNEGERRLACTWGAASYLHEGDSQKALAEVERCYAIAGRSGNRVAMSADLNFMGNILLEAGRADAALERFEATVATIDGSDATAEVKETARRNQLFDLARVALQRGDVTTAAATAERYRQRVAARRIPFEVWRTHQLAGLVALARGDAAAAATELAQANPQDPQMVYQLGLTLEAAGKGAEARQAFRRVAEFNGLNLNYGFVRGKAKGKLESTALPAPAKS
jgi:tetratricopeptide (TPR) repeat protein